MAPRPGARVARVALAVCMAFLLLTMAFTAGLRAGEDRVLDVFCGTVDQNWSRDLGDCTTPEED